MTGTMGLLMVDAASGHNLTPHHAINLEVIYLKYSLAISHIMVAESFTITTAIIIIYGTENGVYPVEVILK
jgi:hypothetical protein